MHEFDLIIVGGGFVGASLAQALALNTKLKIALIDARTPQQKDPRLFALAISSWQFLKNIGLDAALKPHASPIKKVHVSQQGKFGSLRLSPELIGLESLGYMLPAFQLENALQSPPDSITQKFSILCPATLCELTQNPNCVEISIEHQGKIEKLKANFVIGCDGSNSTVRKLLAMKTLSEDYQQTAIVTQTQLSRSHHGIAYERITKKGVIAMLPLPNETCATIWSGAQEEINHIKALSDSEFLVELQQNFGFRLGKLQKVNTRYTFPLQYIRASKMVKDRVMLLGNSAHTLHPIAAQGLNLAIYEIALLVDAVIENKGVLTKDILANVASQVTSQQNASIGLSHNLASLLAKQSLLLQTFLPVGVFALDKLPFLKTRFIKRLLGRTGRVPQLLVSGS